MNAAVHAFGPAIPYGSSSATGATRRIWPVIFPHRTKPDRPGWIDPRASSSSGVLSVGFDAAKLSGSTASLRYLSPPLVTNCEGEMPSNSSSLTEHESLAPAGCGIYQVLWSGCRFIYQNLAGEVASSASIVPVLNAPMDALVAELEEMRDLREGWDGEGALAPDLDAIDDAVFFVRSVGYLASRLDPAPDVDGSILLEVDDGRAGSFRFKGDRTIIYALRGVAPGRARFDGSTVPEEISQALDAVL